MKCKIRFLFTYVYYYLLSKVRRLMMMYIYDKYYLSFIYSNGFFNHLDTTDNFQTLFLIYYS